MILQISGDKAFQVLAHSFSVSPSQEDYNLQYSANGTEWSTYPNSDEPQTIPSGETLIVTDCAFGQYIRLDGNNSDVTVIY